MSAFQGKVSISPIRKALGFSLMQRDWLRSNLHSRQYASSLRIVQILRLKVFLRHTFTTRDSLKRDWLLPRSHGFSLRDCGKVLGNKVEIVFAYAIQVFSDNNKAKVIKQQLLIKFYFLCSNIYFKAIA